MNPKFLGLNMFVVSLNIPKFSFSPYKYFLRIMVVLKFVIHTFGQSGLFSPTRFTDLSKIIDSEIVTEVNSYALGITTL